MNVNVKKLTYKWNTEHVELQTTCDSFVNGYYMSILKLLLLLLVVVVVVVVIVVI